MGRKARHTARTGDGGAELRHKQRQVKDAEREKKSAELQFFDDPSENDDDSEEAESEGSQFGDEEEVLQLGGSGEDEDEDDSDDNESDDDVDDVDEFGDEEAKERISKMDSKWGKSKKTFYSADTAEFELEADDEAAKDEESAALELQRKQATMMDDEDFGFDDDDAGDDDDDDQDEEGAEPVDDEELLGDQLADISMLADDGGKASVVQVKKDFSKMSKKDKLQIVNQTAPELLGLSAELENTMKELNEVVTPAIMKLKEVRKRTKEYNTGVQYLVTRQNLMLNYVANISFYLLLRAEGKSVTDHPVLQHLLALKKQMTKLQSVDDSVNMQLHELLTGEFPEDDADDGLDKFIGSKETKKKKAKRSAVVDEEPSKAKKQKAAKDKNGVSQAEKKEAEEFYEAALREKQALQKAKQQLYSHEQPGLASSDEEANSDLDEGAKRGASYEIIKNKGLKAHKSKMNRNPRVKKRMQYRKAVIRRKGQVRDVRVGEAGRYGGETTGIKSNLTRSRKIRS